MRVFLYHFSKDPVAPLGEAEVLVCRLLEHFLRVADDNCHEVCQVDAPPPTCSSLSDILATDGASDQVVVVVGVAIYLRSSLFNNRWVWPQFLITKYGR